MPASRPLAQAPTAVVSGRRAPPRSRFVLHALCADCELALPAVPANGEHRARDARLAGCPLRAGQRLVRGFQRQQVLREQGAHAAQRRRGGSRCRRENTTSAAHETKRKPPSSGAQDGSSCRGVGEEACSHDSARARSWNLVS